MEIICEYFLKNKYSNKEIALKKKNIYNALVQIFKDDLNINKLKNSQIRDMLIIYDNIFLFDNFYKYLEDSDIILNFVIDTDTENNNLGSTMYITPKLYKIILYQKEINKLIKSDYNKIGGIKCYNKIQCLMNIFEHELIHVIIYIFCPSKEVGDGHGEVFQTILKNIFGHNHSYFSNLTEILNMSQKEIDNKVNLIKKKIKLGNIVESYTVKNKKKEGEVINIEENYVIIKNKDKIYFEYIDKIY